jgi:hypothetical protein
MLTGTTTMTTLKSPKTASWGVGRVTAEAEARFAERVPGTGKLLDTEYDVRVDVLSVDRFPGDGQPKPIAFPDPATTAIRGPGFALLPLPRFIELELASGMSAPHRLHDLADVLDLIRSAELPTEPADDLHPWVRDKFIELWYAAQGEDPDQK